MNVELNNLMFLFLNILMVKSRETTKLCQDNYSAVAIYNIHYLKILLQNKDSHHCLQREGKNVTIKRQLTGLKYFNKLLYGTDMERYDTCKAHT